MFPTPNPANIQDFINKISNPMGQNFNAQSFYNAMGQNQFQNQNRYNYDPFYENLVEKIDPQELSQLAADLKRGINADLESRQEWEQKGDLGLKLLGFTKENNTNDPSASAGVWSSAFSQSLLSLLAQLCSVLLPPRGPCRMKVMDIVKDKNALKQFMERSTKVGNFMNNMLTDFSPDYYPEAEQALFWTLLYGSCFKKPYFDDSFCRPVSKLIKPDDLIVNSNATSLLNAPRITYRFFITPRELKLRQLSGLYADVPLEPYKNYSNTPLEQTLERITGIQKGNNSPFDDPSTLYEVCETRVYYDIKSLNSHTSLPCPYLITLEKETSAIISIRRNWDRQDSYYKRINDLVRYPLFHGFGVYGLGLIHIIGNSSEAATELLRQLIFSAKISNFPAFLRRKGMRMDKSTVRLGPGESAEVETGGLPIQDCFMRIPNDGPTQIFKQVKDDLETNVNNLTNSMNTVVADMNPNAPVGTTLALIEQSSKIETSIIKRLHKAFAEELNIIYKLVNHNFDRIQSSLLAEGRQFDIQKADFQLNLQILPVSDPNLATSTHLLIQSEALSGLYQQFPNLINARSIAELKLKALKVEDTSTYLVPEQEEIQPRNFIIENMDLIQGKPARASLEQDQDAHIIGHTTLLTIPEVANDPIKLASAQAHIQEHIANRYLLQIQQYMGQQIPLDGQDAQNMQMQNYISQQATQSSQQLTQYYQNLLTQNQPKQADPTTVLMADIQSKREALDHKTEIEFLKAEIDKYKADLAADNKQRELDLKYQSQLSSQEREAYFQEQSLRLQQLQQENDMIKHQISEIMTYHQNQEEQARQHQHELQQQMNDQNHQMMQQNQQQQQAA